MKVALVHDFLIEYGGAERVLEALHEIWPKAPVYTAFYDPGSLGVNASRFKNWKIITSWGMKLPFWQKLVSPYRIFSKKFFESFDLSDFDLVISSSNAYMAKAVRVPDGIHICYCHTPPRFLYGYPTAMEWRKNPLLRPIGEVINHVMRVWDYEAAQSINYFIANSKEVQGRIKKFYRRDSSVIYPPVDVRKFAGPVSRFPPAPSINSGQAVLSVYPGRSRRAVRNLSTTATHNNNYFLVVSRLVAAKNVDVVVEVCAKLGLSLKVVGTGRELENLKKLAERLTTNVKSFHLRGESSSHLGGGGEEMIEFLGEVADEELIELYQNCRAVIFAASKEDFGLVPVEAMAVGKPVIVNAQGGVLESVIDALPAGSQKGTGVYFDPPTTGSLTLAINNFIDLEKKDYFDPQFIRRHAKKFSKERFKREVTKFVEGKLK